jgi:hypothetical protein
MNASSSSRDETATREGPRTWRVWLIVALWVVLVAQFVVDTLATSAGQEPYPTITMPAFSAANVGTDGRARVTERTVQVINRDGTVQPVSVAALLAPLHSGPASLTLDRLLKPSSEVAPEPTHETVDYLKAKTERFASTPDPVGLRVVWQPAILDTRTLTKTLTGPATVREVRW